jgi:23S rRNA G2445 N2-methylase RlmL
MNAYSLKFTCIEGLEPFVLQELKVITNLLITSTGKGIFYGTYTGNLKELLVLKSVISVFLINQDKRFNPLYINNHKSILGNLVTTTIALDPKSFKTFTISCAGLETPELKSIREYITREYKLNEDTDADLKISIGKINEIWEIGVELTTKPLSVRNYKINHVPGGIHPTIAYTINSLCNLENEKRYLNAFCGSATLLIEAAQMNNALEYVGFDYDKKRITLAIQNITKAKLQKNISLKVADIVDVPDFGTFDYITADLPFGMQIAKNEDLGKLYTAFADYCNQKLNRDGLCVIAKGTRKQKVL